VQQETTLDLELLRRIRRLLVPASLFGFAYKNQVFEGKLHVMHMLPICRELKDYLPTWVLDKFAEHASRSFYEYLDWTFHTRHAEVRARTESEEPVQMLYRFEVLIPGTLLYTSIVCEDCTDIELSCLIRILKLWTEYAHIGGKSASGYGRFKIVHAELTDGLKNVSEDLYLRHVQDNRQEIVRLLQELDR